MDPLQKKCLTASLSAHGLLLVCLILAAAFVKPTDKHDNLPPLQFVPTKLVSQQIQGGGGPAPKASASKPNLAPVAEPKPAPKVETPPAPKPEPPKPKPETVKPKAIEPEVVEPKTELKPETKPEPKPAVEIKPEKPKKKPEKIIPNLDDPDPAAEKALKNREREKAKQAKAEADRRAQAEREAREKLLSKIEGDLRNNLGKSSTSIEFPPGLGGGGEAFAYYGSEIKRIYDDAWIRPSNASNSSATAIVEVTIESGGRVRSSRMIKPSGDADFDRSVRQALDRVRKVPPFPEGDKDREKTFRINYNLKSKERFG